MIKISKRKEVDAIMLNEATFLDYYNRLKAIAISLFEWENLPDSCNERFLELTLFEYGRAIFVNDSRYGYLTLKCTPSGKLNYYNEPISYIATGVEYYEDYSRDECVLIRNNYLERPTDDTIRLFAMRLYEAERTIDTNIKAQKTPVLIKGEEKTILTLKNIYNKVENNEPVLVTDKSLDSGSFNVFKTDAPFVADKVMLYKRDIWNECMSFLGINNANTDKKERLITDEVNANNELINIMAQSMYLTRQSACEQINKMYGLNVAVKMRDFNQESNTNNEESEDNE